MLPRKLLPASRWAQEKGLSKHVLSDNALISMMCTAIIMELLQQIWAATNDIITQNVRDKVFDAEHWFSSRSHLTKETVLRSLRTNNFHRRRHFAIAMHPDPQMQSQLRNPLGSETRDYVVFIFLSVACRDKDYRILSTSCMPTNRYCRPAKILVVHFSAAARPYGLI